MPPTVRDLVADRSLDLRVRAGAGELARVVSWVHVSELVDPAPFLEGGELLLTTGLALDSGTDFVRFVRRLVDCGVTGLGFGVGLSHDSVPRGLVSSAEDVGLPLLEVPHRTPFIAISKAVSSTLAAEAYAEVTTTNAAQRALTKAALSKSGPAGVVRRLAQLLDGWVLLLDGAGGVVHAAPAAAMRQVTALSGELTRLRARRGPVSSSFSIAGEQVSVQALGSRLRAFLAVGRPTRLGRADLHILNSAAALLSLVLTRSPAQDAARRQLRTGLLRLILAGHSEVARGPVEDLWGPLPAGPVRVLTAAGSAAARDAFVDLLETEAGGSRCFFAELADRVVVLVADQDGGVAQVQRLARQSAGVWLGISDPIGYDTVDDGLRQSVLAAETAQRSGVAVLRFADLAGRGLLSLVDRSDADAFAESLLGPLIRHDATGRGALVASLREWLRQHGQWDPAAARLCVHRHTLRNRIGKVEELLGASLDDPGTRAELWLALQQIDPG